MHESSPAGGTVPASGPIVVGVDGSAGGRRALAWALTEAAALGVAVEAVSVWHWDGLAESPLEADNPTEARLRAEARQRADIDAVLAGRGDTPPVSAEMVEGAPGPTLVRAARGARMLVLGSHGHGLVRQAVLGSVSRYCIRHADCAVVIVPTEHARARHGGDVVAAGTA